MARTPRQNLKEKCTCKYKCSSLPNGYSMISRRAKLYHASHDKKKKIVSERWRNDFHEVPAQVGQVGTVQDECAFVYSMSHQNCIDRNRRASALRATDIPSMAEASVAEESGSAEVEEDEERQVSPCTPGDPWEDDEPGSPEDPCNADEAGEPAEPWIAAEFPPAQGEMPLSLNNAMTRRTLAFQSMLDEAKCPKDLQDHILRELFCETPEVTSNDYRGIPLGSLLRHAGQSWDGGPLGLRSFGTFKGLEGAYKSMGAPQKECWRMCLGGEDTPHDPVVLGPSTQDDVHTSTGPRCSCVAGDRGPSLQTECCICVERCTYPECNRLRRDMIEFYYLPIGPAIAKLLESRSNCHKMLPMWRERDRWLQPGQRDDSIRQWWDGSKAKEHSWFWNPESSYELPVLCSECYSAYSGAVLVEQLIREDGVDFYELDCKRCGTHIRTEKQTTNGDPRNIALMAHWDGFQSARSIHRSTWTVEISCLNAGCNSDMRPFPVLFIPHRETERIIKRKFHHLGAFLEPVIRDLQCLFVFGIPCHYSYPHELIHPNISREPYQCRAMLEIFTGDHPAQCKFGGWCSRGFAACRRCRMRGTFKRRPTPGPRRGVPGQVVYACNRFMLRDPPAKRDLISARIAADEIESCRSEDSRTRIMQRSGISSKSNAWRLTDTYGFCIITDLVYDVMHVIALNMFKNYVDLLMKSLNTDEKKVLEAALADVTERKPKSLDGRWPKDPTNRLAYFKAEEYTRFVIYCLPHALHMLHLGDDSLGKIGILLSEIGRMFFVQSRKEGWQKGTLERARTLLASWRVRSEEAFGEKGSVLEHVAGSGELIDDIERHGPHWGFWCYGFERMVSGYGQTPSNNKEKELTYTTHHARLFFTRASLMKWKDDDGLLPHQRALIVAHNYLRPSELHVEEHAERAMYDLSCPIWHRRCTVVVQSQKMALALSTEMSMSPEATCCQNSIRVRGIGVTGGSRRSKSVKITSDERDCLEEYWAQQGLMTDRTRPHMSQNVTPMKSVVVKDTLFRKGDHVLVQTDTERSDTFVWNWRAVITKLFLHEFMGTQELFFEAKWFLFRGSGRVETDPLSGMVLLNATPLPFNNNNCRPVSRLVQHFIPICRPIMGTSGRSTGNKEIVCMELEEKTERKHIEQLGLHVCPTYPRVNDLVDVKQRDGGLKLAVVRSVRRLMRAEEPSEDDVDWEGVSDNDEDTVELEPSDDASRLAESGRSSRGVIVWVSWVTSGRQSQSSTHGNIWKATEEENMRVDCKDIKGLKEGFEVIKENSRGCPV